jgi:Glycosyltransferase family 87
VSHQPRGTAYVLNGTSVSRVEGVLRTGFIAFAVASVAFDVARFWTVLAAGELFHRLGFDWTLFYAQAMALRSGAGAAIYDQSTIDQFLQPLLQYYAGPQTSLDGWPQPYPPFFAAVMVPFTLPAAPTGFALWLAASLVAALFLAYRVRQFLPELGTLGAVAAVLATIPVAWGLFMGQPMVLLAVAVSEMFISFKADKDFRAGLWLSALLLKPQYAVLFGIFILWKRRWSAVGGAILGGLALLVLGAVTAGPQSYLAFANSIKGMSDLHGGVAGANLMMNWRAIVLAVRPTIGEITGQSIVWTLSVATMVLALLPWRGRWSPGSRTFAPRFALLTLGALVSSYHSHPHGAALLIVPLAAAWAAPTFQLATRAATWIAVYALTFIVVWVTGVMQGLSVSSDSNVPLWTVWPNVLPAVLFMLAFGLMSVDVWTTQRAYRA